MILKRSFNSVGKYGTTSFLNLDITVDNILQKLDCRCNGTIDVISTVASSVNMSISMERGDKQN